jgi:hypothetical protein
MRVRRDLTTLTRKPQPLHNVSIAPNSTHAMNKPCQHTTLVLPLKMITPTYCQDAQLGSSALQHLLRLILSIQHQVFMEIAQLVHIVLKWMVLVLLSMLLHVLMELSPTKKEPFLKTTACLALLVGCAKEQV